MNGHLITWCTQFRTAQSQTCSLVENLSLNVLPSPLSAFTLYIRESNTCVPSSHSLRLGQIQRNVPCTLYSFLKRTKMAEDLYSNYQNSKNKYLEVLTTFKQGLLVLVFVPTLVSTTRRKWLYSLVTAIIAPGEIVLERKCLRAAFQCWHLTKCRSV